jgi:DNA-binding GntR family transcriptional regulator
LLLDTDNSENVLKKKVLSEQIKEQLIAELMNKKYVPGDKLVESAIAKRFGVSQAPVREAMKGLAEMGFVTVEPYKGTTVRSMSKEDVWETLTVRAALESLAAGIAAEKITPEEVSTLERLANEMVEAAKAGDSARREKINIKLHDEIIRISGHKLIMRLSNSLRFASWSQASGTFTTMNTIEIASRHKKLIEPLKNHDSDGAARAMREHIEASARSMLENWKEDSASE